MSDHLRNKNKFLTGFKKFIFFQYLKIYVFLKYFSYVIERKITLGQFLSFLKRVLLLFEKIKVNKVVKTRKVYKIHLYLPAFPSKAFFIALDKFLLKKESDPADIYPTSVLLSINKNCNYKCPHCYQKLDSSKIISLKKLKEVARKIQALNISFINIEGGEPLLDFKRLTSLLKILGNDNSEIWINTNGAFLTEKKAKLMKKLGVFGLMISLHHWKKEGHDNFTGVKGAYDRAINALRISNKIGLSTAINCTGGKRLIKEKGFFKIMEIAKNNNCALVQLIHEKPAGAWLNRKNTLEKKYVDELYKYHLLYSRSKKYVNYPAISSQAYEAAANNFGCTAGGIERFYINASGEIQPCEFVNVSFGNLEKEPFLKIYSRMRRVFDKPRTNWICCCENEKIKEALSQLNSRETPLKKSTELIKKFNLGKETEMYKKMKLYE